MIGDYVLHYPVTDFAVSLIVVAAFVDLLGRALERPNWKVAVDWLLFTGFAGGLAALGTGLWLVAAQDHANDDTLSLHRWFAYSTLCAAAIAVAARMFERRLPKLNLLRTAALAIAAGLVCCTGYVGGKMTHSARGGHVHTHDEHGVQEPALEESVQPTESVPAPNGVKPTN